MTSSGSFLIGFSENPQNRPAVNNGAPVRLQYLKRSPRRDPGAQAGEVIYSDHSGFSRLQLGGAAGVALLIHYAGRHEVSYVSAVGDDEEGETVRRILKAARIRSHLHIQGQTTRKWRFVALPERLSGTEMVWPMRVDRDCIARLPRDARLLLQEALQKANLLVVVDHGKGFVRRLRSFLRRTTTPPGRITAVWTLLYYQGHGRRTRRPGAGSQHD